MKLSEIISRLNNELRHHGDIDIVVQEDDGRSTYPREPHPIVKYRQIWENNPPTPMWFLDM